MPSTKSPPEGNALSTRQMLDELDALMERMLALPVNDLDDLAREPLPRPTLSATLTVIDAPEMETAEPAPTAMPATPYETPSEPTYYHEENPPEAPTAEESNNSLAPAEPGPAETYERFASPAAPEPEETVEASSAPQYSWNLPAFMEPVVDSSAPLIVPPTPVIAPLRRPRRSLVGWLLSPAIRFNRSFDGWLERFGGLGRWLRQPSGRLVLGMFGLSMLALAIAWFVRDLASWTR